MDPETMEQILNQGPIVSLNGIVGPFSVARTEGGYDPVNSDPKALQGTSYVLNSTGQLIPAVTDTQGGNMLNPPVASGTIQTIGPNGSIQNSNTNPVSTGSAPSSVYDPGINSYVNADPVNPYGFVQNPDGSWSPPANANIPALPGGSGLYDQFGDVGLPIDPSYYGNNVGNTGSSNGWSGPSMGATQTFGSDIGDLVNMGGSYGDAGAGPAIIANLPAATQAYYNSRGVQNFDPNGIYEDPLSSFVPTAWSSGNNAIGSAGNSNYIASSSVPWGTGGGGWTENGDWGSTGAWSESS